MIAAALEHVDQAPGARVADAQAALDHRDRGGLRLDDEPGGLLEQVVLVGIEVALGRLLGRRLDAPPAAPRRTRARPGAPSAR